MRIRPAIQTDAAAIAQVRVQVWRSTYRGLVPDAHLDAMDEDAIAGDWHRHLHASPESGDFVVVAETDKGDVVGFACAGPNRDVEPRFAGELHTLYLLAAWHGRGTGRRLVVASAHALLQNRISSMIVWVLGGNPFRAFYGALGGEYVCKRTISVGGVPLEDIAYGWPDIRTLVSM